MPTMLRSILILSCLLAPSLGAAEPLASATEAGDPEAGLLILADHRYVVGILPQLGGRVMVFRRRDGRNALHTDPASWRTEVGSVHPATPWIALNGHSTWLGPQSAWWTQQVVHPQRREAAATWPPDPYLTLAAYTVEAHGDDEVVLRGPHSAVSGVTLTKRYRLTPAGLQLEVTCTNSGERSVRWDLWSNLRFDGDRTRCYVRVAPGPRTPWNARVEARGANAIGYRLLDGWFTLEQDPPPPDAGRVSSKYFIESSAEHLVAFPPGGDCFVATIGPPPAAPANGQARIEIYAARGDGPGLLELEHHGAVTTLEPGESMTLSERWSLHPYSGPDDPSAQVAFLTDMLNDATAPSDR